MTGNIRTVTGDIPPGRAGVTYAHEHLIIDSPLVAETMQHIHLPSVDEAKAEVERCLNSGVRTMVDAMPAASGRHPERLRDVASSTGIQLVAATGLHTDKYYREVEWTRSDTPEQLAQRFIADIEEGIDRHDYLGGTVERTSVRAGVIKAGSMTENLSGRDQRLFEAAALAAAATGAPILTHTEGGLGGMNQIEVLTGHGVPAWRIALSHTDKVADQGYHRAMLDTGVLLCYDQGLRDLEATFTLAESMVSAGFSRQILLGTDGARRSLWSTLGGNPGLASLYPTARDRLDPEVVAGLFVENPATWLTFNPVV